MLHRENCLHAHATCHDLDISATALKALAAPGVNMRTEPVTGLKAHGPMSLLFSSQYLNGTAKPPSMNQADATEKPQEVVLSVMNIRMFGGT